MQYVEGKKCRRDSNARRQTASAIASTWSDLERAVYVRDCEGTILTYGCDRSVMRARLDHRLSELLERHVTLMPPQECNEPLVVLWRNMEQLRQNLVVSAGLLESARHELSQITPGQVA